MTLEEVIEFMNQLNQGIHSEHNIPVAFHSTKLIQEFRETSISNLNEFHRFLSCVYCAYRKIEVKMTEAQYPGILSDFESQGNAFVMIGVNLHKAKTDY